MKRKNDTLELILLGVGILLLLLLFVVKRRLDAPEETATAESRTETMEGKKQEETIQNMEQENERRRIHSFPAGDDLCDGTGMRGSCACGAGR